MSFGIVKICVTQEFVLFSQHFISSIMILLWVYKLYIYSATRQERRKNIEFKLQLFDKYSVRKSNEATILSCLAFIKMMLYCDSNIFCELCLLQSKLQKVGADFFDLQPREKRGRRKRKKAFLFSLPPPPSLVPLPSSGHRSEGLILRLVKPVNAYCKCSLVIIRKIDAQNINTC